jgi:hypothetical protein
MLATCLPRAVVASCVKSPQHAHNSLVNFIALQQVKGLLNKALTDVSRVVNFCVHSRTRLANSLQRSQAGTSSNSHSEPTVGHHNLATTSTATPATECVVCVDALCWSCLVRELLGWTPTQEKNGGNAAPRCGCICLLCGTASTINPVAGIPVIWRRWTCFIRASRCGIAPSLGHVVWAAQGERALA